MEESANEKAQSLQQTDISNRACRFAEWLQENRWFSFSQGKWNYTFEDGTSISKKSYDKNYRKTTEELYIKFCQEYAGATKIIVENKIETQQTKE